MLFRKIKPWLGFCLVYDFVNCHGKSSSEIVELIKRIDSDNDLYFEMLSQPLFKEEYRNIDFHKMNKDKYVDFFKSVIWKEIHK